LVNSTLEVRAFIRVDGIRSSSAGDELSQSRDEGLGGEASYHFDVDSFGGEANEDGDVSLDGELATRGPSLRLMGPA
jgi:hypothetical protein